MKILKKWHRSTVFLREWPFFWQNLDLRAACFLENGRFLQNMGMRAMIFPWEIGKKGHHIDFFGSYYSVVLIELMFLIKYGHDSKGFLMKILKKLTYEHSISERMDVFTKYGHESEDFSVRNRKKRASCWLFWLIL